MHKTSSHLLTLILAAAVALSATACHADGLTREERRARKAAVKYYEWLQRGRTEKFVSHIAYADAMSDGYRGEMNDLMAEHLEKLRELHGGLSGVKAVGQVVEDDQAQVFLQLSFADSTSEEVGLPMVKVDGEWLMQ